MVRPLTAPPVLVIAGPTGSGKSALALELAQACNGEIISCDSVQVYRGFDIGSAKASAAERGRVPHHLLDIIDWHEPYDAARFARDAARAVADIRSRGRPVIVAGGTGLYLRALLGQGFHLDMPSDEGLRAVLANRDPAELYQELKTADPVRAAEIHPHDALRIRRALELVTLLGMPLRQAGLEAEIARNPDYYVVVLNPDRPELHARIAQRTAMMLAGGLIEEVRGLLAAGVDPFCKPMQSIGYRQAAGALAGQSPQPDLAEAINAATRQYAKRQCTWFRRTPTDLLLNVPDSRAVLSAWLR